jgi:polyphosphate kinase
MKTHTRIGILSLVFGVALLGNVDASGAATMDATQKKCQAVVRLQSKNATKEQIAEWLRNQLGMCKVSVSEQEVQQTANNALNLVNKSKDPLKGVIYIKTKKFTFCVSWGDDKTFCKAPPAS